MQLAMDKTIITLLASAFVIGKRTYAHAFCLHGPDAKFMCYRIVRNFRGLAILHENCSLIRIICYNVQRLKDVASGKQSFCEYCAAKCF